MMVSVKRFSLSFIAAVLLALTVTILWKYQGYFIFFMAFMFIISAGVLISYIGFENVFPILIFSLPISVLLPISGETTLQFPSEIIVAAIAFGVFIHWIRRPDDFSGLFNKAEVWWLVFFLIATAVSVLFSEMITVSVKAFIIKSVYAVAFLGGGFLFFKKSKQPAQLFNGLLFTLSIVAVIIFTEHARFDFAKGVANYVTEPFFRDHTIYSAFLVFIIPVVFLSGSLKSSSKWFYWVLGFALIASLLIASSRAALLSFVVALLMASLVRFGLNFKYFIIISGVAFVLMLWNSESLLYSAKSIKADSNARNATLEDQTISVVSISSDESNAERYNRWVCAWRMFEAKPFTGFGPGTYQFVYFPFQRIYEMTPISVSNPYNIRKGRGGTAHNEYLLILSESGIIAAVSFLTLILLTYRRAFQIIQNKANPMAYAMLIGFTSLTVHSVFNNFLDTDKIAVFFYLPMAYFITALTKQAEPALNPEVSTE
ncbi:MAG: O-antigen ligase family protein [Bacteroidetes bacterium]|nr:O-antigen ligase family protein [Bacteroidota bacterium]